MITTVACSRLRTNSRFLDRVRESARRVLILIGGEGITALIKRELESEHFWVRHGGLNWAFVRANDDIVERLAAIARRPIPHAANGKPESDACQEFIQATTALAALGADTALVEIIWQTGVAGITDDLVELRAYRGQMPKPLTDRALQTLQSEGPTEESLLIALIIAWLSGDEELIPTVCAVLERTDPEDRVARYACIALQSLGDSSDDFVQLAQRLAYTNANSSWGINALASLGNRGLKLLGDRLMCRNTMTRFDHDIDLIRILYDHPASRKLSVDAAVDCCLRGSSLLDRPYDIAGEAGEPAMRELILDKAFAVTSIVTTEPLRAIEGLAKFDGARAVEAIELGLQSYPKIERQLCRLLVRIAPEAAAARLINAATSIERESLRRAAGRALRRLDPGVVSDLVVERMSGYVSERKTVAELAGWLPIPAITEALGRLADHDSANEVRYAALAALDRHSREVSVRALLAAFPSATPERRWSLLVAILDVADPHLLTDPEDPLWLGNILSGDIPAAFEHHAKSMLSKRKQKED
jgi:HEAT repeat protein